MFVFPAKGLAIFATEARRVTDDMFITAAEAVAEQIFNSGLAGVERPGDIRALIKAKLYIPEYKKPDRS